jgi:uncharacterized SAM-binding protein YcdF (DUF218 family)
MTHSPDFDTNEVILLGAGMEFDDIGNARLNHFGIERADRFLQHYTDHKAGFSSREAFVVCTGGYGLLAGGIERPEDNDVREGIITADYLIKNDVPHQLIRVESESVSTLTNLTHTIDLGYVVPGDYNAGHRLGVISHPNHLKRAASLMGKLSLPKEVLTLIPTQETDNAIRELLLRSAYRILLFGAYGSEDLCRRERLPGAILSAIRRKTN